MANAYPPVCSIARSRPAVRPRLPGGRRSIGRKWSIILSHGLWERRFGSDPAIIGRAINLDGQSFTVVGVMPRNFQFPKRTDKLWVPMPFTAKEAKQRGNHYLEGRAHEAGHQFATGASRDDDNCCAAATAISSNEHQGIGPSSLRSTNMW